MPHRNTCKILLLAGSILGGATPALANTFCERGIELTPTSADSSDDAAALVLPTFRDLPLTGQEVSEFAGASVSKAPQSAESNNDQAADSRGDTEPQDTQGQSQPVNSSNEIVVTALRSDRSFQETPAAVTLVEPDILAKQQIVDVSQLQNVVPATRFSKSFTSTRIIIRGIGSVLDYYWIPELTATNFNGVYLPRYAINGGIFDLDNVQLLPGPQGVLYGRSAGGGALLISAHRPTHQVEASGSFQYGNYDLFRVDGMGNVPITDDLAVRGAFIATKRDGYESNGADADDSFSVRLSALYEPTTDLSAYLWFMHYKQTGTPQAFNYIPYLLPGDPWYVPVIDPLTGNTNSGTFNDYAYSIGGYDLNYELGNVTIDYTGSVLRQTEVSLSKVAGNDRPLDNAQTQYTQHLQFNGKSGRAEWVAGADYYHADSRYDVRFGAHQFGNIFPEINQTSYSFFGQGTISLTPSFRATGGLRWSSDHLDLNGTGIACFATCSYPPVSFDHTWRHVDWKVGLETDLTPDVLVYANVQTGYAPGTLNTYTNTTTLNKEISPQTLMAYTGGVKSQFFDRHLTFNLEGYYYAYDDLVVQAFNAVVGSNSLFNIPKATIYGAQLHSVLRPWANGTFTADIAWTHARYGHFQSAPSSPDIGGHQAAFAPNWTYTLAYDHTFDLANDGHLDARLASYISTGYWATFDHTGTRQDAYSNSDFSLIYYAPDDRWHVGAWIKNVENSDIGTALGAVNAPPIVGAAFLEPPRTYGLTLGFKL